MKQAERAKSELLPAASANALSKSRIARALWLLLACTSLLLGIIGIVLPGLPTTPFVLLAAFAAARGSLKLRRWLHEHRVFGSMVADWEGQGAVSRRAKITASATMLLCALAMFATAPQWWMAASGSAIMLMVAIWLWLRPLPR